MTCSDPWRELSQRQLQALAMLSFAMPLHADAHGRLGISYASVQTLERRGLAKRVVFYEGSVRCPIPFWQLTQVGNRVRRGYIRAFRNVDEKVGILPKAMTDVASLPI